MLIRRIEEKRKSKFPFVLRRPDGSVYESVISGVDEVAAEQRLKKILQIFNSRDEIVRLKTPLPTIGVTSRFLKIFPVDSLDADFFRKRQRRKSAQKTVLPLIAGKLRGI